MSAAFEPAHVVRFAGDSGDGIQLSGKRFAERLAAEGNELATAPDFPAEIRAPAGSLAGVSAFQVQFAGRDVLTAGDHADVLVAMNPAALVTNLASLRRGGLLILNGAAFTARNLKHAGLADDPRADGSLDGLRVVDVDLDELTLAALADSGLRRREALRCRNYTALGLVCWLYGQPLDAVSCGTERTGAALRAANALALRAGRDLAETLELPHLDARERPAEPGPGRLVTGNEALALGLMAAAERAGLDLYYSGYPITPASDLLQFLAAREAFGVRTLQAEDEIGAACAALGASFAGALAVTGTSGPGMDLKSETLGLAVSLELPLVVVDVQRAGPSTGIPTRAEQSDLDLALHGRHGEAPLPVIAARGPAHCFEAAYAAARLAVEHMTPVILLSDAAIANGSQRWQPPALEALAPIAPGYAQAGDTFAPYERDQRGVRAWATPGTPGLEHRIGGLEKRDGDGEICYDPANHQRMTDLRAAKVAGAVSEGLAPDDFGAEQGCLLVVSWGGTFGAVRSAVAQLAAHGHTLAHTHLHQLHPLPPGLATRARHFKRVLVAELNQGQLLRALRAALLIDAAGLNKVSGQPFTVDEVRSRLAGELEALRDCA